MKYIKDEEFIRGDCPMTKEEIRILSIAKLEIEEDYNLLDIGAGTGSISIQMSKCSPKGKVVAIEMDEEALKVIYKNKEKINAENLQVIEGEALQVEKDIKETFDGIFIGGSGGNITEIIESYSQKLKPKGKIVLNFITINNLYLAMETLKKLGFKTECIQIGVSKTRGNSYMLVAGNPIFIISGSR